jgi:stage II sporulation protein D
VTSRSVVTASRQRNPARRVAFAKIIANLSIAILCACLYDFSFAEGNDAAGNSIHSDSLQNEIAQPSLVSPRETDSVVGDGDVWNIEHANLALSRKVEGVGADGNAFRVPASRVRILLRSNVARGNVFAPDGANAGNGNIQGTVGFSGAAAIERGDSYGRAVISAAGLGRIGVSLPCTLLCRSESGLLRVDKTAYRGSVIIMPEQSGLFSLENLVNVEDYLCGVVPLEVGKGGAEVVEAVKAQAVAARTYTYRKMIDNATAAFDLNATVADQMYGGANVESALCSKAIRDTRGMVMTCRDSLIYAYYHSTCGGRTANIEDVWTKSPFSYLRSVDDENGWDGAFCSKSASFVWEERWSVSRFSTIVDRFSQETFPQNPCTGDVRGVTIDSHFGCGRVRRCTVHTSKGDFSYGGDKIRFVFRRDLPGFPILRSSIITDASLRDGNIVIKGKGYGHGVGMCQTGALGRARSGQNYLQILKAYYTGIDIKNVGR